MSGSQGIAYSSLRSGKRYRLKNHGETFDFTITDITSNDFHLKDIHTLEMYLLSDLTRYGKGADFSIWEI
ncbi:MAG: hypothetical protein RIF33_14895 [Cyclobacteriaceae bacterium]